MQIFTLSGIWKDKKRKNSFPSPIILDWILQTNKQSKLYWAIFVTFEKF